VAAPDEMNVVGEVLPSEQGRRFWMLCIVQIVLYITNNFWYTPSATAQLEDIHAGIDCPTCACKEKYSHITEAEMKSIMKNAVDKVFTLLCSETMTQRNTVSLWNVAHSSRANGTNRSSISRFAFAEAMNLRTA
jgi:hypothetical protein